MTTMKPNEVQWGKKHREKGYIKIFSNEYRIDFFWAVARAAQDLSQLLRCLEEITFQQEVSCGSHRPLYGPRDTRQKMQQ